MRNSFSMMNMQSMMCNYMCSTMCDMMKIADLILHAKVEGLSSDSNLS